MPRLFSTRPVSGHGCRRVHSGGHMRVQGQLPKLHDWLRVPLLRQRHQHLHGDIHLCNRGHHMCRLQMDAESLRKRRYTNKIAKVLHQNQIQETLSKICLSNASGCGDCLTPGTCFGDVVSVDFQNTVCDCKRDCENLSGCNFWTFDRSTDICTLMANDDGGTGNACETCTWGPKECPAANNYLSHFLHMLY